MNLEYSQGYGLVFKFCVEKYFKNIYLFSTLCGQGSEEKKTNAFFIPQFRQKWSFHDIVGTMPKRGHSCKSLPITRTTMCDSVQSGLKIIKVKNKFQPQCKSKTLAEKINRQSKRNKSTECLMSKWTIINCFYRSKQISNIIFFWFMSISVNLTNNNSRSPLYIFTLS